MNQTETSKGSKFLAFLVFGSIFVAMVASFFRYYIKNDFLLYIKAPCDPMTDSCFAEECEAEDVRCGNNYLYYKIVYKNQSQIPNCISGICPEVNCEKDESTCEEYFCTDENIKNFEVPAHCV